MKINFKKMHGLGNDYIYLDCVRKNKNLLNEINIYALARKLSDRNFGIGSDGLILIFKSDIADFKMQIINSDGTEAEMCGNGIRCAGKFIYEEKLISKDSFNIETKSGIRELNLILKNNLVDKVKVNMGKASFDIRKINMSGDKNRIKLKILNKDFDCECVSMGNPHAVIFINNLKDLDVKKYGREIETHEFFKKRINVEFAKVIDKNYIEVKVWERGSGETLACGTGACAVYAVAFKNNLIDKSQKVKIKLPGGELEVFCDENKNIFMIGEAKNICQGSFDLSDFI